MNSLKLCYEFLKLKLAQDHFLIPNTRDDRSAIAFVYASKHTNNCIITFRGLSKKQGEKSVLTRH